MESPFNFGITTHRGLKERSPSTAAGMFQQRREVQKTQLFGAFFGSTFSEKVDPEKDTSKTHLWGFPWPLGGTQCDFWVPNGSPLGHKICKK